MTICSHLLKQREWCHFNAEWPLRGRRLVFIHN